MAGADAATAHSIRYGTQEVVLFRHDLMGKMRRNALLRLPDSAVPSPDDLAKDVRPKPLHRACFAAADRAAARSW